MAPANTASSVPIKVTTLLQVHQGGPGHLGGGGEHERERARAGLVPVDIPALHQPLGRCAHQALGIGLSKGLNPGRAVSRK